MDARRKPGHDRAMNWISNVVRPKIRSFLRRETPENLWIKCPETGQLVFYKDVEANQFVIPSSGYHMRISAPARLKSVFDDGVFEDLPLPEVPVDPLRFRDERRYADRLKDARTKTGLHDAVKVGVGTLEGLPVTIGVQDFDFMGGSLGMAAGEAFIKGIETAVPRGTPYIMFAASGGGRRHRGLRDAWRRADCRARRGERLRRAARDRADDPREAARRVPAFGISLRTRHGRHGRASPQVARDPGAAVPGADQGAGVRAAGEPAGSRARIAHPDCHHPLSRMIQHFRYHMIATPAIAGCPPSRA